jgi:hypothetical protein
MPAFQVNNRSTILGKLRRRGLPPAASVPKAAIAALIFGGAAALFALVPINRKRRFQPIALMCS